MNPDIRTPPLPAPLPYSSQAGRGEIPAYDPLEWVDDHYDPDAPLMREDDLSFYIAIGFIVSFIILMTLIAWSGGL